jgi:formate hydrogenlyase subunit 4
MNLDLIAIVLQTALLLLLAPLVSGCIKNWKAKLQNRRGPRIWQPYSDLSKFFRKDMVISEHASWVFSFAPYVVFLSALLAGLMVPMLTAQAPLSLFGGVLAGWACSPGRFFALGGLRQRVWRHGQQPRDDHCGDCRAGDDAGHFHRSHRCTFN